MEISELRPSNPDLLAIIRLFLENYSVLAEEDRVLYRKLIRDLANPLMVMKDADRVNLDGLELATKVTAALPSRTRYQQHVDLFAAIAPPAGLLLAAREAWDGNLSNDPSEYIARCVCRWIAENPLVPTLEQWADCLKDSSMAACGIVTEWMGPGAAAEWQRRMFLAPTGAEAEADVELR